MELSPGSVIAARYRLERKLGEGGMGVVWTAVHTVTRRRVALKILKPRAQMLPQMRTRFLREARAASAVRHPNVVDIHDVVETDDGTPVMVMELLEGETLGERLERETRLSVEDTARMLTPVVSALGTAHALGIVHRDLKPDNVFLANEAGGVVVVKVLDFGIAKLTATEGDAAKTAGLTGTGAMMGTPFYMSPEQAFGEKDIDHRSDIWSVGLVLYQCISGVLPTKADNLGQILKIIMTDAIQPLDELAPHAPAELLDLVRRMLSRQREDRPADLREVQAILSHVSTLPAPSFGAPARPRSESTSPGGEPGAIAITPGSQDRAPTPAELAPTELHEAVSAQPSVPAGAARNRLWLLVGIGGMVVAGGSAVWLSSTPPRASADDELRVPSSAPAIPPAPTLTGPAVTPEAPAPTATPIQTAIPTSSSGKKPPVVRVPPAIPTTTPSISVAPPPTAPPTRSGGLVDKPPF